MADLWGSPRPSKTRCSEMRVMTAVEQSPAERICFAASTWSVEWPFSDKGDIWLEAKASMFACAIAAPRRRCVATRHRS